MPKNLADDDESRTDFPKIIMCSDSMHSKAKVRRNFPDLSRSDLMLLYGQNVSQTPWENSQGKDNILWALKGHIYNIR